MKKQDIFSYSMAFIMALFMFAGYAVADDNPSNILKKADRYFHDEEYEKALTEYLKYDEINPGDAKVNYRIGVSYLSGPQKQMALPYFKKVESMNKMQKGYDLELLLARSYHLNHKFDSAAMYYTKFKETVKHEDKKNKTLIAALDKNIEACKYGQKLAANPLRVMIEFLDKENINTKYNDYSPVLTADEQVMFFTSRRPSNKGDMDEDINSYYEDIYMSKKDKEGKWMKAERLPSPINTDAHDATAAISADGSELIFYRSDRDATGDLYSVKYEEGNWGEPKKLSNAINSIAWEPSVCLSPDGKYLYFTSDREGGYGGLDVYRALKMKDGTWGLVSNLGPTINTQFDEDGPYILADNETLLFSSRGHKGIGGYDVFQSKYDFKSGKWQEPRNIGFPLNTADDDVYFVWSANGQRTYYSSAKPDVDYSGETDLVMVDFGKAFIDMTVYSSEIFNRRRYCGRHTGTSQSI